VLVEAPEPMAFTMNRGDFKKLAQEIHLEQKISTNNHNQSQIIVQDVSRYYSSDDEQSQSEISIIGNLWIKSEDHLDTESEPCSVNKVTSNPQGPSSVEPHPKMPMTPKRVLQIYSDILTDYEQTEVLNKTVYFIGSKADKIEASLLNDHNFGYDDENGDYQIVMKDHIDYRYEVISLLGQGSFGQVIQCYDHKKKEKCAIKIIRNKKKFHDQALVEVRVLEALKENDPKDDKNIIRIIDHFNFRNHICITFELLSINMYDMIKDNNFEGLPMDVVRQFAVQLLQGLKYMRQLRIIHWDLKPENILLTDKSNTKAKIIDFGSSCFEEERIYTYIQSRFYRAPEIILGTPYTQAIDIWSFACIIIELFIGFPIFPGESEGDQLARIMEYKGIPPINVMEESTRSGFFFNDELDPLPVKNSRGGIRKPCTKSLIKLLDWNDKNFIRFIDNWLHWDPNLRLSPEEALCHDWILEGLDCSQLIYRQTKLINSQYQSSPDIDDRKMIQKLEYKSKHAQNMYVEQINDHSHSLIQKELNTPQGTVSKQAKLKTQKITFQNFMSEEPSKEATGTHKKNKLLIDVQPNYEQEEEEDEIAIIEKEMNKIISRPRTTKNVQSKKKYGFVEYGNMTELVSEELKRAKRAISKKTSQNKTKHINFKKLFPLLKYGKSKG